MDVKRIIVGIDFSPESELALQHAISMARTAGAEVLMLHASTVAEFTGDLVHEYREVLDELWKESHDRLVELRERYSGQGPVLSHVIVDGPAHKAVAEAAAEVAGSVIAIGTHGRTGFRRLLLGSVAEKVIRRSDNTVLVVRPGRRPGSYRRILVPTDFSRPAEDALAMALTLAESGAEIDLVHYWQLPVAIASHYIPLAARAPAIERLSGEFEAAATARGAELIERYRDDRVAIDLDVVQGPPAPGIVSRAAGYDLIAMGRRGLSGFSRWLVGSVTEATVRHAPCSVLVVRDGRAEG